MEKTKNRALSTILEAAGRRSMIVTAEDERRQARMRLLAEHVWNCVTTGKTTLPEGDELVLNSREWITLVQWLYTHIDGPPKAEIDLTSLGKQLGFKVYAGFDPDKV